MGGLVSPHYLCNACTWVPHKTTMDASANRSTIARKKSGEESDVLFSQKPRIGLIDWTVQEARRFVTYFYTKIKQSIERLFCWSFWRRKHQAIAKFYHYKRKEAQILKLQL